jgi:hypothetical protein
LHLLITVLAVRFMPLLKMLAVLHIIFFCNLVSDPVLGLLDCVFWCVFVRLAFGFIYVPDFRLVGSSIPLMCRLIIVVIPLGLIFTLLCGCWVRFTPPQLCNLFLFIIFSLLKKKKKDFQTIL